MAARTVDDYEAAESTGESTATGDTAWHDKVELAWTPGASETWYEIASAAISLAETPADVLARYWDGTTAIASVNEESRSTTDYRSVATLHKVVYGGSPAAQSRKWQFATEFDANTAKIRDASIVALKHTTNDQYGEALSEVTITAAQDVEETVLTVAFDPGGTRTYTLIATGEYNCNSTGQNNIFTLNDGNGVAHGVFAHRLTDTTNWASWSQIAQVTLTTGTKTLTVGYTRGGVGTHIVRRVKLLVLEHSGFVSVNSDMDSSRTTSTGTTDFVTKSSVTFTPTAIQHLLLGCIHLDRSGSIASGRLLDDATGRHLAKPDVANSTIRDGTFGGHVRTLTAASTTFAQQGQLDASGSTVGMQGSFVGVYEFDSASGGATASPATVALTMAQPAVTAQAGSTASPAAAALVLTQPAVTATGSGDATASPAATALILTQPAVTAQAGATVEPATAALALAQPAVTAQASSTPTPATAALVLAQPPVEAQAGSSASPAAVALVLTQPAVTATVSTTAAPSTTALVLTQPAVTPSAGSVVTPATVVLVLTQPAVTASGTTPTDPNPIDITVRERAYTDSFTEAHHPIVRERHLVEIR